MTPLVCLEPLTKQRQGMDEITPIVRAESRKELIRLGQLPGKKINNTDFCIQIFHFGCIYFPKHCC